MSLQKNIWLLVITLLCAVLMLQGCGGDGSSKGTSNKLISDETPGIVCTEQYEPVCSKAKPEGYSLDCVQEPCENYEYRTFPNSCYADREDVRFSFQDECEGLENQMAFNDNPVRIKELAEVPIDNAPITITHSEIEGDIVTLEVSYSGGCGSHELNLFISNIFMESNPVQTESILSHVTEDPCDAVVTEELTFDLLPIREFYQRSYGQGPGSINIQGVGLYSFD